MNKLLILPTLFLKTILMANQLDDLDNNKDGRTKRYVTMRSIMDLGMGFFYILVAAFLLLADKFGVTLTFPPKPFSYIFAAICVLYGGFRIYRGIQKNYFR